MTDAWERILADKELALARKKLSIHEIRLIIRHAQKSQIERFDNKPYDRNGPEVSMLHRWFAEHASPSDWHDDGCRSENARDLLNAFSAAGFIIVPAPAAKTEGLL